MNETLHIIAITSLISIAVIPIISGILYLRAEDAREAARRDNSN